MEIHVQNVSYCLYIAYGVFIADLVYILSSVLSFVQNLIILGMIYYFRCTPTVVAAAAADETLSPPPPQQQVVVLNLAEIAALYGMND